MTSDVGGRVPFPRHSQPPAAWAGDLTGMNPMLVHDVMAHMRTQHPDWIWNRSDTHAFLAPPRSHESFKTIVEPGNAFSPGPETYGMTAWVFVDGTLYAPEEMALADLAWRFRDGYLPVLDATWWAGPVRVTSSLFSDGDVDLSDVKTYLTVTLENESVAPVTMSLFLVVRSFGPAGGPIRDLELRDGSVWINGGALIHPDRPPDAFGAMSYEATGQDISVPLRHGVLPPNHCVSDPSSWASGALEYRFDLPPGEAETVDVAVHLHAGHSMLTWLAAPERPLALEQRREAFLTRWRSRSPVTLDLPDVRVTEAFFASLTHMAMLMVGDAPRVSVLTYPLWWVRDASYIVNALDKGGYHDLAARACRDAVRRDAATGFGSEADVPGELIWMLTEHALLTGDEAYLREVYPFIAAKAELLMRMATTEIPLKAPHEFCTHEQMLTPVTDLICLPAQDGLIVGRMDHHFPTFWVNGFAWLGLTRAAWAAGEVGEVGACFVQAAAGIRKSLERITEEQFGRNDRDVVCSIWPTGWADPRDPRIQERFDDWWARVRHPHGAMHHEPLWTYFEVGEAHNYLLLGQRERVWSVLEHFLTTHSAPGLYCYPEGERDENSASLLWQRTRGWDQIRFVTPNLWTSAELFLLLRDVLVREDGDRLVIGSGVPLLWMDAPFSIRNLPTRFGPVSFSYEPVGHRVTLEMDQAPPGGFTAAFPLAVDVEHRTVQV